MSFEFYLIYHETRERAVLQIKTGNRSLNSDEWKDRAERVFLLQPNGLCFGGGHASTVCVPPSEIETFMLEKCDLLPASTVYWMDYVGLGSPQPAVLQTLNARVSKARDHLLLKPMSGEIEV